MSDAEHPHTLAYLAAELANYRLREQVAHDAYHALKKRAEDAEALVSGLERDAITNGGKCADQIERIGKLETSLEALIAAGNAMRKFENGTTLADEWDSAVRKASA